MKLYYDSQVDALYLELRTLQPGTATARDLTENVTANYAPDGQLAGIEILEGGLVGFRIASTHPTNHLNVTLSR